jgi:hypothetical protein
LLPASVGLRFCGGSPVALPERVLNVLRGHSANADAAGLASHDTKS